MKDDRITFFCSDATEPLFIVGQETRSFNHRLSFIVIMKLCLAGKTSKLAFCL